jgi:polysaccharide biosynthesis transport protein
VALEEESEFDLRQVFGVLRRRAWAVGLFAALGVVAAIVVSLVSAPLFASTTQVRIVDPSAEAVNAAGGPVRVDREREVDTQVQILKSAELRSAVDDVVGPREHGVDTVSVSPVGSSDVIEIRTVSRSPETARDAADAYAELFVERRRADVAGVFDQRAQQVREQASELDQSVRDIQYVLATEPDSPQTEALRAELQSIIDQQAEFRRQATAFEVEGTIRSGNVTIVQSALLPSEPFSPNLRRDLLVFGGLGLIVGVGLALLLERLDDRVKSSEHVEALGVPLIGRVPRTGDKRRVRSAPPRAIVDPATPTAEAFRTLATSVRFSAVGSSNLVLAITSPERGEGKSTIAANLAVALAEADQRVILISADLRCPTMGEIFHVDESAKGLTTVLLGDAPLSDCFQPIRLREARSLYLLPAGPPPYNPHELLASNRMKTVLEGVANSGADYVLIDCPPVVPIGDTLALAHAVDGLAVVAAAGQTNRKALAETIERLQSVGGNVVGVILNRTEGVSRYDSTYGGYGYGTNPAAQAPTPAPRVNGTSSVRAVPSTPLDELQPTSSLHRG